MSVNDIFEGDRETSWCPGCGNFAIRRALVGALKELEIGPHEVTLFSGIGQAAKMPHYLKVNGFNGLHGRALPLSIGMVISNPTMNVIVESGDGDSYGEGGNHLIHTIRRNPHLAHFVHNNHIYGLTKGQASPTSYEGMKTHISPHGPTSYAFNPILFGVAMEASFVARSFSGDLEHLQEMMVSAIKHRGYALVDILQPCPSFNRINTLKWYRERVYRMEDHDDSDFEAAIRRSREWGERIPLGIFYQQEKKTFREQFPQLEKRDLLEETIRPGDLDSFIHDFRRPEEIER